MPDTEAAGKSLPQRLRRELVKYAVVSGYLFASFCLLMLYEATAAGGAHDALHFGIAAVKALVLGKFLLIGEALQAGAAAESRPLLHRVAWKALAMLGVLLVFSALEELLVGWVHHKPAGQVLGELFARNWLENLAPVLVMLFILIPLVSISEIYRQLGHVGFRDLWLSRPSG